MDPVGYIIGVGLTRNHARSALPNAPVVPDPKYGTVYLQNGLPLPGVYPVIGPPPTTTSTTTG